MKINVFNENNLLQNINIEKIVSDLEEAFNNKYSTEKEISLIIVSTDEIHRLNNEFRHIDRPTDVLSFEEYEEDSLGEIFICDEKVIEQANSYNHSVEREFAFLLSHGIFHLLGYDHQDETHEKIMINLQENLLQETDYAKINYLSPDEIKKMDEVALKYYNNAYTPYSKFNVGASALLKDGTIIGGCNIENGSYGLSNCAERTTLFKVYSEGYKKEDIKALLIIGNTADSISPCGACRQVTSELMDKNTLVILSNLQFKHRFYSVKDLLPYGFDLGDLDA